MADIVNTIIIATYYVHILAVPCFSSSRAIGMSKHPAVGTGKPSSKIAGGVEVPIGSVPHQVLLTVDDYYFCPGSIIDRDFVITAGQCCLNILPTGVLAGLNDLSSPEDGAQKANVDQVVSHPNCTAEKRSNDICLLHLKEPLTFGNTTAIVKLPPAGYAAKGNANVTGWGSSLNGSSSKLMSAQVPIVSDDECREYYGSTIVESMLCAGDKGKGACFGDTGGPLVDSGNYLVGVVSWGNACSDTGYIGVYTEVSSLSTGLMKPCLRSVKQEREGTIGLSRLILAWSTLKCTSIQEQAI